MLQTKETLTLKATSFGSKCDLSEKVIKKVGTECGVMDLVASFADFKNNKELKKSDGSKRSRVTGETLAGPAQHHGFQFVKGLGLKGLAGKWRDTARL